jgi:hypothetical protein
MEYVAGDESVKNEGDEKISNSRSIFYFLREMRNNRVISSVVFDSK